MTSVARAAVLTGAAALAWAPGGTQAPDPASAELAGRIALVPPSGQKVGPGGTVIWLPGLEPQAASATTSRIASRNKRFEPHVLAVLRGTSVAFPNADAIYHNAFSLSPSNPFDLGLYRKGASRSVKLDAAGVVRVYCNIHPEMAAYLMVVDGAFAVLGDDGAYRIPSVPAGRRVVRLWNEMAGEQAATLEFEAGRATDWSLTLDGSQYRRAQHQNKHGKDYPPATKDADRY